MKQVAPKHSLKCLQKQFCQNLFLFSSVTVVPQLSFCSGAVSLWHQCVGQDSVYSVSVDRLLRTLSTVYTSRLPEKTSSMADSGTNCAVGVSIHLCVCVCFPWLHRCVCVCLVSVHVSGGASVGSEAPAARRQQQGCGDGDAVPAVELRGS